MSIHAFPAESALVQALINPLGLPSDHDLNLAIQAELADYSTISRLLARPRNWGQGDVGNYRQVRVV
jgi:hypothetical protein